MERCIQCHSEPNVLVEMICGHPRELPRNSTFSACTNCMRVIWNRWGSNPHVLFIFKDLEVKEKASAGS